MSFSGRIFSDLLSTLLSMQARGSKVGRKNPLFRLFRIRRLRLKKESQIDDCPLPVREDRRAQNSAYRLLRPTAQVPKIKATARVARTIHECSGEAVVLYGRPSRSPWSSPNKIGEISLSLEPVVLDQPANEIET